MAFVLEEEPRGRYVLEEDDKPAPLFGDKVSDESLSSLITGKKPNGIGRQLGLTGRHLIEGGLDTVGILSDPLAAMMRKVGIPAGNAHELGQNISNRLGLPSPQDRTERIVGDASRLMVSAGGFTGAAKNIAEKVISPVAKGVYGAIAQAPAYQLASGAGAGLAGGTVREEGGGFGAQFGASLLGGLGAPLSLNAINSAGNSIRNLIPNKAIDIKINNVINQAGIDLNQINSGAQQAIKNDVKAALNTGNQVSPDAVRRMADYRALSATPMRSNITLNPVDITRDKNAAKVAANSTNSEVQKLPMLQYENNKKLITSLNDLGANTADDAYGAGQKIIGALDQRNQGAKKIINTFYDKARATDGRSALIDPSAFTNKANNLLDDSLLGGKLPSDVRNLLNKTAKGEIPLTVDTAEQFKTRIGDLQRATNDRAEKMALGYVRQALDEAPLIEGQGQGAINAFNDARRINSAYMKVVESTPALKSVRDGIEPDKFVNQYIIGNGTNSNVLDVAMLKKNIKGNKEAENAIRGQILSHLKSKAVSGAADEVANFSPTGYNKALNVIGERKLNLFFNKDELEQMKRIGRVAAYENFQSKGSAVNNSNSASALFSAVLEKIGNSNLVKAVPLGSSLLSEPAKNISISLNSRRSMDIPSALTFAKDKVKRPFPIAPLLYGGLLSQPE